MSNTKIVKQYEVWFLEMPQGDSHIFKGRRPCIVVSNNVGNYYSPTVMIVPLGSAIKKKLPTHVWLTNKELDKPSVAFCEQIVTIDKCRLEHKLTECTEEEVIQIKECLKASLAL